MRYEIQYTRGAEADLATLRVYDRRPILATIDEQLAYQPLEETRNKKPLGDVVPHFEYLAPLRELRVGEYRVLYDVEEVSATVTVRAVRAKPPEKRTEDIL